LLDVGGTNKHLDSVFKILLPELEKEGIDYWVFGGVGVAAYIGKFIRENFDVDVFVKESDFKKAGAVLQQACKHNNYKLDVCEPLKNGRPKLNIIIDTERMSVIPVYTKPGGVLFKFKKGSKEYSSKILERVERNISGYKFFTPPNNYIKELFINCLISRPDKKNKPKIKDCDARVILTKEEFMKIYNEQIPAKKRKLDRKLTAKEEKDV